MTTGMFLKSEIWNRLSIFTTLLEFTQLLPHVNVTLHDDFVLPVILVTMI